jgi:hypothetical protein
VGGIFFGANPTLIIEDEGLTYEIGGDGFATQLTPIPVGFTRPGQPNVGAPGSGPYVPPYPPFPPPGAGNVFLSYASPTGVSNNVAPPGFQSNITRLWVTLPSGSAEWTGLKAGVDGQEIILTNADPANNLQLDIENGGSIAANQFYGTDGEYILNPGNSIILCYYGGSQNQWVVVS